MDEVVRVHCPDCFGIKNTEKKEISNYFDKELHQFCHEIRNYYICLMCGRRFEIAFRNFTTILEAETINQALDYIREEFSDFYFISENMFKNALIEKAEKEEKAEERINKERLFFLK